MKFTNLFVSLCLGASLAMAASSVSARELKIGVGLPPSSAPTYGLEVFAKTLKEKSAGELDVRIFPMSLLSLSQMFAGVRDGVVDAGFMPLPMFPSELPESQLAVDLAMLGTNPMAMTGAMTEYNFSCQECLAERLKNNFVYMGSVSTGHYAILSAKKIVTLNELRGKKLRSAAGPWSRWAGHFGAVAVNISGNELFEAMSQGTIDGAMNAASELTGLRLMDVVKHVTLGMPGGTHHGLDLHNVNRNTWRSLTEAQRRAMLDSAASGFAAATWKYVADGARSLKEAQQKGIQIHQAPPDVIARSKAFVDADLVAVAQAAEKNYGIRSASQKIVRFRQLVEKWEKLTPETGNWEPAALAEIYHREIFSKIDAQTYGM